MADSMSRPWSSVPSQNVWPLAACSPGSSRLSSTSMTARSYGFCGEIQGANTAISTITASNARPNTASGLATKSLIARRSGVSARRAATAAAGTGARLLMPERSSLGFGQAHARIERRVQQVDQQVDGDEERDDHEE